MVVGGDAGRTRARALYWPLSFSSHARVSEAESRKPVRTCDITPADVNLLSEAFRAAPDPRGA